MLRLHGLYRAYSVLHHVEVREIGGGEGGGAEREREGERQRQRESERERRGEERVIKIRECVCTRQ